MNPLIEYFSGNSGRVIFKWMHFFDIYHRHFERFRNTEVTILEIGVLQGGSLQMWKHYFGPGAKIIGIDIDPLCKKFEEDRVEILIGSQEDRNFLRNVKRRLQQVDIIIDDGGHRMNQQITTFEEMYPFLDVNGIYLAEDVHTSYDKEYGGGFRRPDTFVEYSKKLIDYLNAWHSREKEDFDITPFTLSTYAIHYYDSIIIFEKKKINPPYARMSGNPDL